MIKKDPKKSFEIMGADVKQTGEPSKPREVPALAGPRGQPEVLRRRARAFSKEAAELLLEAGIIKQMPDMGKLADTRS
jgi:NitT/TauT family transport system substrate-binding protein